MHGCPDLRPQQARCSHQDFTCSRPLPGRSTASRLIVAPRKTPDSLVRMAAFALCSRTRSCSSASTSSSTCRRARDACCTRAGDGKGHPLTFEHVIERCCARERGCCMEHIS